MINNLQRIYLNTTAIAMNKYIIILIPLHFIALSVFIGVVFLVFIGYLSLSLSLCLLPIEFLPSFDSIEFILFFFGILYLVFSVLLNSG